MKIVFIASGMSVHSYKWVDYFSDKYEVVWVSTSGFNQDFLGNKRISYINYQFTRSSFVNSIIGLFKIVFDVRHANIIHLHYVGFHALVMFLLRKSRLVVTAWGSDIVFAEKSKVRRVFLSKFLKRAQLITCDSKHMEEKMSNFVSSATIKIINFGIDTQRFKKTPLDLDLKRELELTTDKIIISTRNHEPVYDISTVIASAKSVISVYPDAVYIIAGSGSKTAELQDEVRELSLENNIMFVGSLSNADILRFLSLSTVYISSALSDGGIAASTAEAMSAEIPCVITNVADNSDWVKEGVTGMLFEQQDAEQLADKVLMLLNDRNLRANIGKNARLLIQRDNDTHYEMEKMNSLYKTFL